MAEGSTPQAGGGFVADVFKFCVGNVGGKAQVYGAQINNNFSSKPRQDLEAKDILRIEERTKEELRNRHPQHLICTRAMDSCRRAVETDNICIIIGKNGQGKTATAHKVLQSFQDSRRVLQLHSLDELVGFSQYLVRDRKGKYVILFDDLLLGQNKIFEPRKDFEPWQKAFAGVRAHLGRVKLIFTRNDEVCIFENVQHLFLSSFFKDARCFYLQSRENQLSDEEKVSIFRQFLLWGNRSADSRIGFVITACTREGAVGFPEACRIFVSKSKLGLYDFLLEEHRKKLIVANLVIEAVHWVRGIRNWRALISADWDPSMDIEGNNIVHFAVVAEDTEGLKRYFEESRAKTEMNRRNKLGQTPLHLALLSQLSEGVKVLLDHGARVDIHDKSGNLPLHLAVEHCHSSDVQRLVRAGPRRLVNHRNGSGSTPLHLAAKRKRVNTARILLDEGADVNMKDLNGNSFLHIAASVGCSSLVRLLNGRRLPVNVNHKNHENKTPLLASTATGVTRALLDLGARGDVTDKDGNTALLLAAKGGYSDTALALLKGRALGVNHRDSAGDTALHVALRHKMADVAMEIVTGDHGADVMMPGCGGDTPLMLAVAMGDKLLVECLLSVPGCSETLLRRNHDNQTALDIAKGLRNKSIWNLLQDLAVTLLLTRE